jgi:hypothetical protein
MEFLYGCGFSLYCFFPDFNAVLQRVFHFAISFVFSLLREPLGMSLRMSLRLAVCFLWESGGWGSYRRHMR